MVICIAFCPDISDLNPLKIRSLRFVSLSLKLQQLLFDLSTGRIIFCLLGEACVKIRAVLRMKQRKLAATLCGFSAKSVCSTSGSAIVTPACRDSKLKQMFRMLTLAPRSELRFVPCICIPVDCCFLPHKPVSGLS